MNKQHKFVRTNGVTLHVVVAGPEDGLPVILLHGFPEFWLGWRRQIPALARAGFRVLAPDQRGYNLSDKPRELNAYHGRELVADALGLIETTGRDEVAIVGHDWGGAVAWWLAMLHPRRVRRLAILNAPHPKAMRRTLRDSEQQRRMSRYMAAFQLPWLPEALARPANRRPLAQQLRRTARDGAFDDATLNEYRRAWSRPGAYTAMLNWYRAAARVGMPRPDDPNVESPSLIIWAGEDDFLSTELAYRSLPYCLNGRLELLEQASHWVQHEEAERVNQLLADFLA